MSDTQKPKKIMINREEFLEDVAETIIKALARMILAFCIAYFIFAFILWNVTWVTSSLPADGVEWGFILRVFYLVCSWGVYTFIRDY